MFDLMESILLTAVIKKQRNVDNATLYQGKNGNKCYCNAKYLWFRIILLKFLIYLYTKNALKGVLVTLKFLQKIEFTNCNNELCGGILLPPTCKINYVYMQNNNVHMRLIYVDMQNNYVNMRLVYVNMQHNYVHMRFIYVNMQHNLMPPYQNG